MERVSGFCLVSASSAAAVEPTSTSGLHSFRKFSDELFSPTLGRGGELKPMKTTLHFVLFY
jgi:hypothetical protein